ncbi:hypothetical protein OBBRIDRAFT_171172 [Obba rivulosa]|uniref:Uncharacterized protein n=1 Tax=Obba rivulosa TaxID=1052685 RepID=A0A8E2DHM6_9APHY|nr:hypothetical protein OBBRIDRAFT_171172 [Obba rivulosa]
MLALGRRRLWLGSWCATGSSGTMMAHRTADMRSRFSVPLVKATSVAGTSSRYKPRVLKVIAYCASYTMEEATTISIAHKFFDIQDLLMDGLGRLKSSHMVGTREKICETDGSRLLNVPSMLTLSQQFH